MKRVWRLNSPRARPVRAFEVVQVHLMIQAKAIQTNAKLRRPIDPINAFTAQLGTALKISRNACLAPILLTHQGRSRSEGTKIAVNRVVLTISQNLVMCQRWQPYPASGAQPIFF